MTEIVLQVTVTVVRQHRLCGSKSQTIADSHFACNPAKIVELLKLQVVILSLPRMKQIFNVISGIIKN